jgi:hypothetical protein
MVKLKTVWVSENIAGSIPASSQEILLFQSTNGVTLPGDLVEYFKLINGTNEQYDDRFFHFYSLSQFKSIEDELKNWNGVPDYSGIVATLKDHKKYFVFADHMFHLFSYAIRLNNFEETQENEVLAICGETFKKIANSFSEFVDQYLTDAIKLQF